jgi:HSP20 family protein
MYRQDWVPSIFSDFFDTNWMGRTKATAPAINVIEKKDEYKVQVAAPGMTKDDFKIELNGDNQLIVCLDKEVEYDEKTKECCGEEDCTKDEKHHYLRREFTYTSFRQIFNLPESVDRDNIKAKMKHGVLNIRLPKREGGDHKSEMKLIAIE